MSKISHTALQDIIFTVESIQQNLRHEDSPTAGGLKTTDMQPNLLVPSQQELIDPETIQLLGENIATAVFQRAVGAILKERQTTITLFQSTIANMVSLESMGGISDHEVQTQLCLIFETMYQQYKHQVAMSIKQAACRFCQQTDSTRKGASFKMRTLSILEAAYTRSTILTTAETAIIAKAAGITPHQVRTWFQNKRNRGSKRNPNITNTTSVQGQGNRPIQGLPKRAQQIKSEPSSSPFTNTNNPSGGRRQVRGLPRRSQVSHNAPTTSIIDSSLGNFPQYDTSEYGHEYPTTMGSGERMNRSPSFTESLISNSTGTSELPNGGFTSPFNGQPTNPDTNTNGGGNVPQIAVEWGKGILNVPVDVLEGGKMPIFNFTPPSPLNMNFNPIFNANTIVNSGGNASMGYSNNSMMGGQIYDTPIQETLYNPFANMGNYQNSHSDFGLDLTNGLESIESFLSSALSDPSSFEQFQTTLAASPQFSLDPLSPRPDTLDSIPSLGPFSTSVSGVSSPAWLGRNGSNGFNGEETTLDGGFFEALEGLLASSTNTTPGFGNGELGSPFDPSAFSPSRNVSISSQDSFGDFGNGIISANEGIDLSYIAGIPLPPSPTSSSLSLPTFENTPLSFPINNDEKTSMGFDNTEYLQQPSGMCTPSSTTSTYPLITPTTNSNADSIGGETMVELGQSQDQWNWIDGALPFDMVGMEVEMVEYGNGKLANEEGWMMGQGVGMMAV